MTVVLFSTLLWKIIDFLREVANFKEQRSAVVTQATAWVAGILLVWICAHTGATSDFVVPGLDVALGKLDAGGTILSGLLVSSLGSSLVDVKQALDATDSASKPSLLKPPS